MRPKKVTMFQTSDRKPFDNELLAALHELEICQKIAQRELAKIFSLFSIDFNRSSVSKDMAENSGKYLDLLFPIQAAAATVEQVKEEQERRQVECQVDEDDDEEDEDEDEIDPPPVLGIDTPADDEDDIPF